MIRKKGDFALLFAAVLLMILGAASLVFAADGTLEVSSAEVTTSPGALTANLSLSTSGTVATTSAITDVTLDSNIVVNFDQAVATSGTKNKITLYELTNDGVATGSAISYTGTVTDSVFTMNPSADLTADTYYKVTIGSGINSADSTVSSSSIYLGVFKTIASGESTPAASSTFSAVLTSPANSGNVVTNAVNLNSAVFSFTFSEAVKAGGINGDGIVTVKKISGGSEAVASSGAVVASVYDGKITTSGMSGGVTSADFTVAASALEPSATYTFTIKSTAGTDSTYTKTLGTDLVYTFTTTSDSIAISETTFEAIYLYPSNLEKDVPVDSTLQIGFTNTVAASNKITNGKAVQLLDGSTTVAAVYTLSADGTTITIVPAASLGYGKTYTLSVLDGQLLNTSGSALAASNVSFTTTSFSSASASAVTSGSGLTITANLTNATANSKNVKIEYVVRRDKGARSEYGGTVVVKSITGQTACAASTVTAITVNLADITQNTFVSSLSGTVYVDLYIVNNNGDLLCDPIHVQAN